MEEERWNFLHYYLFYHLNMQCLTSVFYLSSFSALFWKHYYWWTSAQCFSYKPITSEKKFWICSPHMKLYSDAFKSFWKCCCFLNPLQHSFVLHTGSQVLLGILLWANTCHAAVEVWSHGNARSIDELCHYVAILNGGT